MASDQVEMYHLSKPEQPDNKENVILRALVGDPKRHKPLAQHPAPTTTTAPSQEAIPASMYTLETRYRPIPQKVLPPPTKAKVYYIEGQKPEQDSESNPVIANEEPEAPLPVQQEAPREIEQEPQQTVLLEPKVILQPVLYSIVGAKQIPVHPNNQQIPAATNEMPSPILYNLVNNPRLQTRPQEPVKQVSEIPQQSTSSLYTVVGNPRVQQPAQEPAQQTSQIPKQPLPVLYSIVANPKLTSNMTYTNTPDVPPPIQTIKGSSAPLAPTLYAVVGETQVPNNIVKDRPPVAPVKKPANEVTMYALIGGPRIPQTMTVPPKTQPLEPPKQQPQPQKKQASAPALYTLVGKPRSPSRENQKIQSKPPTKALAPPRRISRSLERQSAPEPRAQPVTSIPPIKKKRQLPPKEPTIPKSETIFIPLPENERTPRSKQPRKAPWYTSSDQIHRQPHDIPNYDPLNLPDYISPYAYHPLKSYREQTVHPTALPIITTKRTPRKQLPPLDNPNQTERKRYYDPRAPHSLERHSVRLGQRSRLWDYEYQGGSDVDDDIDNPNTYRTRRYRRYRPRTPWIPVW